MDVILAKEIIYMLKNEGYRPGDRLPSERSKYPLTPVLVILIPEKDVRIFAGSLILLKKF